MPRLNICVDDVGLGPGVGEAVLRLTEMGILGSASCMVNLPQARNIPIQLRHLIAGLDLGLHFNLTCGRPVSEIPDDSVLLGPDGAFSTFGRLARRSYVRAVPAEEVAGELESQWQRFTELFGREPDHLDGHHHVQQLPVIRDVVLRFCARAFRRSFYVRNSGTSLFQAMRQGPGGMNAFWIGRPGSAMRRALRAKGIATNARFSGVIPLATQTFDGLLSTLRSALGAVAGGDCLMMAHASTPDPAVSAFDTYVDGRIVELEVLASTDFRRALDDLGFVPGSGV